MSDLDSLVDFARMEWAPCEVTYFATEKQPNEDVVVGLVRFVKGGIRPGGFLCALLENDLVSAVQCADAHNRTCISAWVTYMVQALPSECYGSSRKVNRWIKAHAAKSAVEAGTSGSEKPKK